jgi:tetratricopeptide (TPR) repeat protein
MNHRLLADYRKLNVAERARLERDFSDSPKMLALASFLGQVKGDKFRTEDAVAALYDTDPEPQPPYATLENRFYKLRKKLLDYLEAALRPPDGLLMPEEAEYYQCRNLFRERAFTEALRRLQALEAVCWERNLFEILPNVLYEQVIAHQFLSQLPESGMALERLQKATEVAHAFEEARALTRHSFLTQVAAGRKDPLAILKQLQRLAKHYAEYPRFELLWRVEQCAYEAWQFGSVQLSRYEKTYKQLEQLVQRCPDVPFHRYAPGYATQAWHRIQNSALSYYFNNGHYADALHRSEAAWAMAQREGSGIVLAETDYRNRVMLYCANQVWDRAIETAEELIADQKKRGQEPYYGYQLMGLAYVFGYPHIKPGTRLDVILNRQRDYVRQLEANPGSEFWIGEVLSTMAVLLFVHRRFIEAENEFQKPACQLYYGGMVMDEQREFYRIFAEREAGKLRGSSWEQARRSLEAKVRASLDRAKGDHNTTLAHSLRRVLLLLDEFGRA